jgi:hypothetical protein
MNGILIISPSLEEGVRGGESEKIFTPTFILNAVALRRNEQIESLTVFGKEAQAEPVLFITL